MKDKKKDLVFAALFLAIGMILPLFTSQVKEIGDSLLPMHIPVLLCGFVCGAKWGFGVGMILPFLRSLIFSMPPIYPNAVWMSLELATYGFVAGLLYSRFHKIYLSLITAMFTGRIIWGIMKTILLGVSGKIFTFQAFIAGGLLDAIPGIIIQLILIPIMVGVIDKKRRLHK